MRRIVLPLLMLLLPAAVEAQSSLFGVRGLGQPGRALSVRSIGLGGGFGMLDPESGLNPAALARVAAVTASFSGVQEFRSTETPAGSASLRTGRFPQLSISGPLRKIPMVVGINLSSYTNRDLGLSLTDTLLLRGLPTVVTDSFSFTGGLQDIRGGAAYKLSAGTAVGVGVHVISGSTRSTLLRRFADSTYAGVRQRAEISYAGYGVSLGLWQQIGRLNLALTARTDDQVKVDSDSSRAYQIDLPHTFGAGVGYTAGKLSVSGQTVVKTWSSANSDFQALGAPGASNTVEVSGGLEYSGNRRQPSHTPLRIGAHYATLPFLIAEGDQPHELGVAIGTGTRFAGERGGIDLGLEHLWRSNSSGRKERAWLVSVGVSVRP